MIALRNILAPIDIDIRKPQDEDPTSVAVLHHAAEFANRDNGQLHLIHVLQDLSELEMCTHEHQQQAAAILEAMAKKHVPAEVSVTVKVCSGRPFVEIIRYAREQGTDLIVMGSHGRSALAHLLIGSETENTVRKAPCPVLVVRYPQHEFIKP